MIRFLEGDITQADAEALVNTVNCVGIMGRGIALQFKRAFPDSFKSYVAACNRGEVQLGRMHVFPTGYGVNPRYIINFPTKQDWRGRSHLSDIASGLDALVEEIRRRDIQSIAIPPLGSGLGGLDWARVRPLIQHALLAVPDVDAVIFEPHAGKTQVAPHQPKEPVKMTPGRAALIALMDRYLRGWLDESVSLLEVHKLLYFLQEAGERLRLRYIKGLYGPYAENLRHVLAQLEGQWITGYEDVGDKPSRPLALTPDAAAAAGAFLEATPTTTERISRVADLVEGFETPFGLELLATVHWVASHDQAGDSGAVRDGVYAWSDRKRRFTPSQVELAWTTLVEQGWIAGVTSTGQKA